ncbi:TetR/AcrR family transcriptional regulator [Candidatus Deferrimicrobium sp.]|uniref:TetR/AcrR family transcriptional regulator n=1 Tax=Candidatus Deferrimicrobium sp. TaxID=3060586 RepID=UPI002ED95F64
MARRGPNGGREKRDRILRAAVKIFSRKGFFNSKVSEIARSAEVADGTIYLYFKNKDDLLISLFEEKMGEVVEDVRRRIAVGGNALEKLKIFIENHMDLLEREAGLVEVLQVELRQSTKFLKDYTPVRFFEYLEVISGILEEGKREGVFRPDLDTSIARRAIFGALDELSLTYILSRKPKYHPTVTAAELCRLLMEGLCVPGASVGKS